MIWDSRTFLVFLLPGIRIPYHLKIAKGKQALSYHIYTYLPFITTYIPIGQTFDIYIPNFKSLSS
jgi:hypothetical protein